MVKSCRENEEDSHLIEGAEDIMREAYPQRYVDRMISSTFGQVRIKPFAARSSS